jgi:hypothetical protein
MTSIMKRIIIFISICLSISCYGQIPGSLAKYGKLDFAIPEHPAFSILDNNTDNILRPSNSQEIFSIIYSNFLSGTTPIIPKDFSMEFSPAQLIGINKITFDAYSNPGKRILYDTKISIGAKTSDDGKKINNFAVGIRVTWVDHASLSSNKDFLTNAISGLRNDAIGARNFINDLISKGQLYKGNSITLENIAKDEGLKNFIESLYLSDSTVFSIKKLREKYKNDNWNKGKFETALAFKFNSPDSLMANSYYSKFELYNTAAFKLGKSGQLLLGVNLSDNRMDSVQYAIIDSNKTSIDTVQYHFSNITIASRLYLGTNKLKAFIEGSGKLNTDKMIKLGINVGAEINVVDGLWAMINFGNNWSKSTDSNIQQKKWTSSWYWSIDLRFKIPEKMKI